MGRLHDRMAEDLRSQTFPGNDISDVEAATDRPVAARLVGARRQETARTVYSPISFKLRWASISRQ
jgi:hypothetical protein